MSLSGHAVPLALGMPDRDSWLILIGFLVALVLLVGLLARAVTEQGGLRCACRRIVWETRTTARAFTAPPRACLRYRRSARMLTGYFADPAAADVVWAALDRADTDAGDGCYAPAAHVSRTGDRVRVVIAGRAPAGSAGPPMPWTDVAGEPGTWTWAASAAALRARPAGPGRSVRLPLVLGVDRKVPGVVVVDWLRGPAALSIEGDAQVSRGVLQSLAAQVDRAPDGPPVVVASGVHPRFPGRPLDDVLAELTDRSALPEQAPASEIPYEAPPVVVCWAPTSVQAARLTELCARGQARVLAGGRLPGPCWVLHAEPDGRLLGPGPQVDVESLALGGAVARAVRRGFSGPHRVLPGAGDGPGLSAVGPVRDTAPPKPTSDRTDPVREQAATGRPERDARPAEADGAGRTSGEPLGRDADFDEPAAVPAAPAAPVPGRRPAATTPVPRPARCAADTPEDVFDLAEPDRAAVPAPGPAGVSAAAPQERTPRTP
ncbi:hypothetical protein AB0L85_28020 [Streptomyces sp. NPDC052051]|uniref:hypothetical protein n=1 Tax=Streptomyces sp. NPDC052051 TaxID=3154649 RepID=UPI003449064D